MEENFLTDDEYDKRILDLAQEYADTHSTCVKVKVGSIIDTPDSVIFFYGYNHGVCNCKENGCRRINLYGEASKLHRLPSDCDSIHSEIDAICEAARSGFSVRGATIYVTRYPCENCARAIVAAGIKRVVYGREETISPYTATILASGHVEVVHRLDWEREDNNA